MQQTLVVTNDSHLFVYDVNELDAPQATIVMPEHDMLLMCEFAQNPVIVYTTNGELHAMDLNGEPINPTQTPVNDIGYLTCTGSEIAFVVNAEPTTREGQRGTGRPRVATKEPVAAQLAIMSPIGAVGMLQQSCCQ